MIAIILYRSGGGGTSSATEGVLYGALTAGSRGDAFNESEAPSLDSTYRIAPEEMMDGIHSGKRPE